MIRNEILKTAKPILFNTEMVRAILDGIKTVTRRPVKTQKYIPDDAVFGYTGFTPERHISCRGKFADEGFGESFIKQPYCKGDYLYVREAFAPVADYIDGNLKTVYAYKASTSDNQYVGNVMSLPITAWHPSIHMPKEAARIFLRVTNVSVAKLQDIDDDGIVAEGLKIGAYFDELWNSTVKKSDLDKYGWDANPWVWIIEFERVVR